MKADTLQGTTRGIGFFAGYQAEGWTRLAGMAITALEYPQWERAQEFAAHLDIPRLYPSPEELLRHERLNKR